MEHLAVGLNVGIVLLRVLVLAAEGGLGYFIEDGVVLSRYPWDRHTQHLDVHHVLCHGLKVQVHLPGASSADLTISPGQHHQQEH